MLVAVPRTEFLTLKTEMQRHIPHLVTRTQAILRGIMGVYGDRFCTQQQCILMFILNATYASGRQGAQIMMYQFERGLRKKDSLELICGGLQLAEKTIRKHLGELSEAGFITIYSARIGDGSAEIDARIFEIDCKRLAKLDGDGAFRGSKPDGGGVVNRTPHHRGINEIAKAIIPGGAGVAVVGNQTRGVVQMLKPPKRGYYQPPAQSTEPAASVVAKITALHTNRQSAAVAAAVAKPADRLTKAEMQALIDENMALYHASLPRVLVTNREHGFLVKRLREAPPDDFRAFLSWAFRYWTEVARQNAKATNRRASTGEKVGAAMPQAPSFSALAYRYPYLLKAYANFRAERGTLEKEQAVDHEVKRLSAEVERLAQEGRTLRNRLVSRTPTVGKSVSYTPPLHQLPKARRPAPSVSADLPDADIPAWDQYGEEHNDRQA